MGKEKSKIDGQKLPVDAEGGPRAWFATFMEKRYIHLKPRLSAEEEKQHIAQYAPQVARAKEARVEERLAKREGEEPAGGKEKKPAGTYESKLLPGRGDEIFAPMPKTYWHDLLKQYRQRKTHARSLAKMSPGVGAAGAPAIPGATNWVPIGPNGVAKGQPTGRPTISGRSPGIAISADEARVYIIGADGGVWRSDDGGSNWSSMMDQWDEDPTALDATSLACGAIAINISAPDRIYVGTGEGDTNSIFRDRVTGALPCYRGIGPVMSNDGGATWSVEPTDPGSPTLEGAAFYALAVDPNNPDSVVGATNTGLYHREANGAGGFFWVQKNVNGNPNAVVSSVVVTSSAGGTQFFAAVWGDKVYQSSDAGTWTAVGTGFPGGANRIGLAVQPNNPNTLYALASDTQGNLLGVYRLDNSAGAWNTISGAPADLFPGQGDYDLTIEVDPNDASTIYFGGSYYSQEDFSDAAIYKATVAASGNGPALSYSMTPAWIGKGVHPDVHCVKFSPGSSDHLWVCCDGGIFRTTDASATASFSSCNAGLGTLSADMIGQHPTQSTIMFIGLQDNGTARYSGQPLWQSVNEGDGGHCIVNWNKPDEVISFANGQLFRATDGGLDYPSWTPINPQAGDNQEVISWESMMGCFATTPYNPGSPADADVIAAPGDLVDTAARKLLSSNIYISADFGTSWPGVVPLPNENVFSMAFASANILYVGTVGGSVYQLVQSGGAWASTRIDNISTGALPIKGLVAEIAVDFADASGNSIYIAFAGVGDYRHIWHFDGNVWVARSGPAAGAPTSLLDVETNAIIVDPATPTTLYAGADIGVWKSTDGGANWTVMENGLPDAAVLDLQIHPPSRLLRAALHGRGVFQYQLDPK
jgi:hypothetical protein